jgi:sporulation protein YabP
MNREIEQSAIRSVKHTVSLDNRERAVFSGVQDVESFNDEQVVMITSSGAIILSGQNLHISKLNLEEGLLVVDGFIYAMEYDDIDSPSGKGGMLSRLFK